MWKPNTETFLACDHPFESAKVVLFGAPYDSTTSFRPGARFGPQTIRSESVGLETYSPYINMDLTECRVLDTGDLELRFGSPASALDAVEAYIAAIAAQEKIPFMLGGEYSLTLGAVRALHKEYPDLAILQLDAHTDLRQDYLGEPLSHACVMRRCWEIVGDGNIYQLGIRSGDKPEWEFAKEHTILHPFSLDKLYEWDDLCHQPVYLTVDLDVLDPSVFPGTGTPEPGGVSFDALRQAMTRACMLFDIVGCDVMELSPHYDHSGISTAAACKIVREMLLALHD